MSKTLFYYRPEEYLVDSGSDTNLFPAAWGVAAGIKIEKGEKKSIHGIGGIELIAYRHSVKLWVNSKQINTFVDFSSQQSLPLLGRIDFFSFFPEVIFNENKRYVELET